MSENPTYFVKSVLILAISLCFFITFYRVGNFEISKGKQVYTLDVQCNNTATTLPILDMFKCSSLHTLGCDYQYTHRSYCSAPITPVYIVNPGVDQLTSLHWLSCISLACTFLVVLLDLFEECIICVRGTCFCGRPNSNFVVNAWSFLSVSIFDTYLLAQCSTG